MRHCDFSFWVQVSSCLMEVPGVIMTVCRPWEQICACREQTEQYGGGGGDLPRWRNTARGAAPQSYNERRPHLTAANWHQIGAAGYAAGSLHFASPMAASALMLMMNQPSDWHHLSQPVGCFSSCFHPPSSTWVSRLHHGYACPPADQWAGADQLSWDQRTWFSVSTNDAWQASPIDDRSYRFKPLGAEKAGFDVCRGGGGQKTAECHTVRAEWPSFSPPSLFETAKRCYKQVHNGPLVPNRPVCISQTQKATFHMVRHTGTSGFSHHTNVISHCHLLSIPGTGVLFLSTNTV